MFHTIIKTILRGSLAWLFRIGSLLAISGLPALAIQGPTSSSNYLHTSGNRIVDASGAVVGLSGLNWFGLETSSYAPHGLWSRNWEEMLDQIQSLGYNVIRLPFSNAMLAPGVTPTGIDYGKNPDLVNLSPLEVMDRIIAGAQERGIRIILDNHRSSAGGGPESNGLWYTSNYPESRWIEDWKMLAGRYKGNDTVIGMDLRNEPFGACWGCNDPSKDWRLAAEKAGNAILSVNPNLLIIVEGVAIYENQSTWWGGNLMGVKDFPIRLDIPDRLVYSPHEYPASVYPQSWFSDPTYPNNLPAVWEKYWGYLAADTPLLIGEFGTKLETEKDRQWLQAFQSYVQSNRLNWTFWSLNPNSGDTGGLLLDDWLSVQQEKQAILKTMQYPFIRSGIQTPPPISNQDPTPMASGIPATATPYTQTFVLDDFESGNALNWTTFQSPNSFISIFLASPWQTDNFAMGVNYSIGAGGWAGVEKVFTTPQDWSPYQQIRFRFYGVNSGDMMRFELLENRAAGSGGDTAERFEYKFIDNFNGWVGFDLQWDQFVRRSDWQPPGAPNDGFDRTQIWGFNFSPVSGQGYFQVDDIQLIKP